MLRSRTEGAGVAPPGRTTMRVKKPMSYKRITVQPVAGALGAEIGNVNLGRLDDEAFAEIRQAFAQYSVVYFRDQDITPKHQSEFTARFGPLTRNPMIKHLPDCPDVAAVIREPGTTGLAFGGKWHADGSFMELPGLVSTLHAIDIPPFGGDTLFASCAAAYEALSPGMKALCDRLIVVHSAARAYDPDRGSAEKRGVHQKEVQYELSEDPKKEVEHPLVCTDPFSGRKLLWVTGPYSLRFKDMTEEESEPLLEYLYNHIQNPNFTCRFSYRPKTLGMWNNRATIHFAVCDYPNFRRLLYRVQAGGPRPVGPAMPGNAPAAKIQALG